ncbi:MAG: hypothetical protein QXW35_05110 [Candidatus Aenigmatarchaeota archaeon]
MNFKLIKENSSVKIDIDPVELLLFVTNKNIMKEQDLVIYSEYDLILSHIENIELDSKLGKIKKFKPEKTDVLMLDRLFKNNEFLNLLFKYKDYELKIEDCSPDAIFLCYPFKMRINDLHSSILTKKYCFVNPYLIKENLKKLVKSKVNEKRISFNPNAWISSFNISMLPTKIFFPDVFNEVNYWFEKILMKKVF